METVRLLDSYRVALARDASAVRLLSFLQRDGAQADDKLAEAARLPLHEVRHKLTELYRANFVQVLDDTRYATTDMAEEILAKFGVADAVAVDAVKSSHLPEPDKVFLVSIFNDREDAPTFWRRYVAAAAQSVKQLEVDAKLNNEDSARLWYSALTTLDPASQALSPEFLCRYAYRRGNFGTGKLKIDFDLFRNKCEVARLDRDASNEFFATGALNEQRRTITLALSFARLVAAAIARRADDGLTAAAATTGIADKARTALKEWSEPFELKQRHLLNHRIAWHNKVADSRLVDDLCFSMPVADAFWQVTSASPAVLHGGPTHADMLVSRLRTIEADILAGGLTLAAQKDVLDAIERLRKAVLSNTDLGSIPNAVQ